MQGDRESNSGGEGKRRYFRRRQRVGKPLEKNDGPKETPVAKKRPEKPVPQADRTERNLHTARRRRRSRNRSGPPVDPKLEPVVVENLLDYGDYQPPVATFIYTHVSRPSNRDSYEFRAEHFSKVGRRLEDYEIDLSQLYADDNRAPATPAEE
jgi:hypothetical protein